MNYHIKTIRNMPDALWKRLKAQAEKEGKLLHKFIIQLLTRAIEEREKEEER